MFKVKLILLNNADYTPDVITDVLIGHLDDYNPYDCDGTFESVKVTEIKSKRRLNEKR